MATRTLSRAAVLGVIRSAADALASSNAGTRESGSIARALADACAAAGIVPEEFDAAVADDPELYELQRQAMQDGGTVQPDPGPYAEISRESPSGQAGDTTKTRTHPEPNPALSSWQEPQGSASKA